MRQQLSRGGHDTGSLAHGFPKRGKYLKKKKKRRESSFQIPVAVQSTATVASYIPQTSRQKGTARSGRGPGAFVHPTEKQPFFFFF